MEKTVSKQVDKNAVLTETACIALGEGLVALLTVAVFALIGRFSYRCVTGALLGALVTVANFFWLASATNRALDRALAERGEAELTEEEAAAFAEKHQAQVQGAMISSQLLRTLMMLGALVLAFVLPWFDGVAAIVPLVAFRPVLMAESYFRKKDANG